jgi:large repetitive protein
MPHSGRRNSWNKLIASAAFAVSCFLLPVENVLAVANLNLSTSFSSTDPARVNYMDQAGTWDGSAEVTNSTTIGDRFTLRIDNTAGGTTTAFDIDITIALPTGFRLPNTGSTPVIVTTPSPGCNATTGQTDYTPLTASQSGSAVNFNIPNNRNIPAGCIYDFEFGLTTRNSSPFPTGGANNITYTVDYDDGGPGLQVPIVQIVQVNPGLLALTKTALTPVATNGSTVDFRIDIRNNGTGGTFNVVLTDTISANFTGVTFTSFQAFDDTTNAPLPVPGGTLIAANQYRFNFVPANMRIEVTVRTTATVNPLATTCPVMINDAESVQRTTQSSSNFASVDFNLPNSLQLTYEATSYCELCGIGEVRLLVANAGGISLTNVNIVSDLLASGLTYAGTTQIELSFDGTTFGAPIAANGPVLSGANNQILTWSPAEIAQLNQLDSPFAALPPNPVSIRFIFQVRRNTAQGFTEQGLVTDALISRNIEARSTYDLICGGPTQNTISNLFELPIRQPVPITTKLGRNVDAAQSVGNYAATVFGHVDDDIIWRVQVNNSGLADMQDLLIDDSITGNFDINFVCNSEAAATAAAGGAAPGVNCVSAGGGVRTSVLNFEVDDPFGNPANDEPTTFVDVPTVGDGFIYYVGRIRQQCSNQTNAADIEWGCEVQGPDGGITVPGSTGGITPANTIASSANMSANVVASGLAVTVNMTGSNQAQPLGTKGVVTVVIANNTGGTVRLWNGPNALAGVDVDPVTDDNSDTAAGTVSFTDILPVEYVMDTTFVPTAVMVTAYGANYNGMVDSIVHTNPVTAPLANTSPRFRLFSSTQDTDPLSGTVYEHLIRNGDVLTIQFGVVLVDAPRYDLVANLDVSPEVDPATDPDNTFTVNNQFTLNALSYCSANPTINVNASYPANLEDLDVSITDALFILTNTAGTPPLPPLSLNVDVTNNGGHDANDYFVYVSLGVTMELANPAPGGLPAGCQVTTNPPVHPTWNVPDTIPGPLNSDPDPANVYVCNRGTIAPGATETITFDVVKSINAAALAADDLTFRADVVGEITLSDNAFLTVPAFSNTSPLTFPTPATLANTSPVATRELANNYSLDAVRSRVLGFNLNKVQVGDCTENVPPLAPIAATDVQIGEDCNFQIRTGGWFGFLTPGFTLISVEDIVVLDDLPTGQGYISQNIVVDTGIHDNTGAQGVDLTSGGVTPLDPTPIQWEFNSAALDGVKIRDQFFTGNIVTRILNSQVDSSAAPNLHDAPTTNVARSNFNAVFQSVTGNATICASDTVNQPVVGCVVPPGYPALSERSVTQTVTEPNLVVTKTVCNETLSVTKGAACSPFVNLTSIGDTQDTYIYRIQVTNQASGTAARAPAYNVTVIDTLDANDQMLIADKNGLGVNPFLDDDVDNDGDGLIDEADENTGVGGDGIDNDDDGLIDGADTDELIISNNTLEDAPLDPAVITISHTHSTALERIDQGQIVTLYYLVNPADSIAPQQLMTNTAYVTYDTLEGDFGNQNAPQLDNFEITAPNNTGRARLYTSATDIAQVRILPLATQPKQIIRIATNPTANGLATDQNIVVGEEIEYQLTAEIPVAKLKDFKIRDELPLGLTCVEAQQINLNKPPTAPNVAPYNAAGFIPGGIFNATCNDTVVEWDFGDQELTTATSNNLFVFTANFTVRVENVDTLIEGCRLRNGGSTNDGLGNPNPVPALSVCSSNPTLARLTYSDETNSVVTLNYDFTDVIVRHPQVTVIKTFQAVAANEPDANDVLEVTVTATNTSAFVPAYKLEILDDLVTVNRKLHYVGIEPTDVDQPDTITQVGVGTDRPIFSWQDSATPTTGYVLDPGEGITFRYYVSVDPTAQPLEILDNDIEARWTSLENQNIVVPRINTGAARVLPVDGDALGMRNGQLTGVAPASANPPNDYNAADSAQVVMPDVEIIKTDNNLAAPNNAEIGEHREFVVELSFPEGTAGTSTATANEHVRVSDNLDASGALNNESYVLENAVAGALNITYQFPGITKINDVDVTAFTSDQFEAEFNSVPADEASGVVTWDIGKVETALEDDLDAVADVIDPKIIITYKVRVDNVNAMQADLVTPANSDRLQNDVTVSFPNGESLVNAPLTVANNNDGTDEAIVTEPDLTVLKTWTNRTPIVPLVATFKPIGTAPDAGDIIEFELEITNGGNATAYDINIKDIIPANVVWDGTCVPKAVLNPGAGLACDAAVTNVAGFTSTPLNQPNGPLIWGRGNADESLDLIPGDVLRIYYQVVVQDSVGTNEPIANAVVVDWTSLNGSSLLERTGGTPVADCTGVLNPDNYCYGPITAIATVPNLNNIVKTIIADSYATSGDGLVRIGDTIQYRVSINLQEGTTNNIDLLDVLQDDGMELISIDSVNGDATALYSQSGSGDNVSVSPFTYADIAAPLEIAGLPSGPGLNPFNWIIGDVVNVANNNPTDDVFVIEYTAQVVKDEIQLAAGEPYESPANASEALDNILSGNFNDYAGTNINFTNQIATATLQLPIITAADVIKERRNVKPPTYPVTPPPSGAAVIAGEVMDFRLTACNTGNGPAYDVEINDDLEYPLDALNPANIINLNVYANGVLLTEGAGNDYTYTHTPTATTTVGSTIANMNFDFHSVAVNPVASAPNNCIVIEYDVQVLNTFAIANSTWDNNLSVTQYHSLPVTDPNNAQRESWGPVPLAGPIEFNMNNLGASNTFTLLKSVALPPVIAPSTRREVTVGDTVTYQIVVPGVALTIAQNDVVITDDLHDSLIFESASIVAPSNCAGGADVCAISLPMSGVGTDQVGITIPLLEAGEQAYIEVVARVDNNADAQNTELPFGNSASYTFAATPGGSPIIGATGVTVLAENIAIVEPEVLLQSKICAPNTNVDAGDVVTCTLTLVAAGNAVNDAYSDAFDITIKDTLSLGLLYSGTPTVTDSGVYNNTIGVPDNNGGDGISTQQGLTWSLTSASPSNIDITEGDTITVTYEVVALDTVEANQQLSNSAQIQWTGINGSSIYERDGSTVPIENNYINGPVVETIAVANNNVVTKIRNGDTFSANDDVRVGDVIEYRVDLVLQEGTHKNLVLNDAIPQGMVFVGINSINNDTSASYTDGNVQFSYTDIPAYTTSNIVTDKIYWSGDGADDPAVGTTTLTIDFGDVVNIGNNAAGDNSLSIYYYVRPLNLDANVHVAPFNLPKLNSVAYNYDEYDPTPPAPVLTTAADTHQVNLLQPELTLTKSATQEFGDAIVVAGEDITYTVTITNNGTAPAYDVVLRDTLPLGMRLLTPVTTGITSISAPNVNRTVIQPTYVPGTGLAEWDFKNLADDNYSILPGDSLEIVYTAEVDGTVGGSAVLNNSAQVWRYYSFDDEAIPAGAVLADREDYGPSVAAVYGMTTPAPSPLAKLNPAITNASIGVPFTYRITVPAAPVATALYDVRILDNLDLLAPNVELIFVDVQKVVGSLNWVPANTGTDTNLVIEDAAGGTVDGIDIPAGEQISIDLTLQLQNTSNNSDGDVFQNTASYTFNTVDDVLTQVAGGGATTTNMTTVEPLTMVMTKTAPVNMQYGVPGTYLLDVENTGNGPAYDLTIVDHLPDPVTGGMCDTAPDNFIAEIRDAGNALQQTLTNAGPTPDFVTSLTPSTSLGVEPTCTLTITMQSANAVMQSGWHLLVYYDAHLDADNFNGDLLINYAAAWQWFSGDTPAGFAVGEIRQYPLPTDPPRFDLTDPGTPSIVDHQARGVTTVQSPELVIEKTVFNVATNLLAVTAEPTESLRYQITIRNIGPVAAVDFSLSDEIDRLNPAPGFFVASSIANVSVIEADATNTIVVNPTGGAKGTGLIQISDLDLDAAGGNDLLTITFEVTLETVIDSGNIIRNQAEVSLAGFSTLLSDDPALAGIDDPTETRVGSSPLFQLQKISTDITGDPNILNRGDVLTYTLTVKNVGAENASSAILHDQIPANTTYVPFSTTLNGVFINDPATDVSPLQDGLLINAIGDLTAGFMRANADPADVTNIATVTFNVTVNSNVVNGTVISNQGFISGEGVGSGAFSEQLSDDPGTDIVGDPTRDIVGNVAIIDAQKTVVQLTDTNGDDLLDPLETIRYTIVIQNSGLVDATGVVLTDSVPANTTYIANTLTMKSDVLNGFGDPTLLPVAQPDGGVLPLITGVDVSSSNLIAPLPASGAGTISPGETVTVSFDVSVNAGTASGTVISNQGEVVSNEFPDELTDVDGNDTNGDQPTNITVGSAQQLSIVKNVFVVGGGVAQPGGQLEYLITVTNNGNAPIDLRNQIPNPAVPPVPFFIPNPNIEVLKLVDDIEQLGVISYVAGSARLNGAIDPNVTYDGQRLTVNFDTTKRAVSNFYQFNPGDSFTVRYLVDIDTAAIPGTDIVNTAAVDWGAVSLAPITAPIQCFGGTPNVDACSVSTLAIGGAPGVATLSGNAWHDSNFDLDDQAGERDLAGWEVQIYFGQGTVNPGDYLDSVFTDATGAFNISGLVPNINDSKLYALKFLPPGSATDTASLGNADSIFTDGPQQITVFDLNNSSHTVDMNLPIQPNGVVYNAITRAGVSGVVLQLLNSGGTAVPASCFDDPVQQNQRTTADGYYKFELNFSDAQCPTNDDYSAVVTQVPTGYIDYDLNLLDTVVDFQSRIIPPLLSVTDPAGFNVQTCTGDAQAATPHCEVLTSEFAPPTTIAPRTAGTDYYMKFNLVNFPTDDQLYNNHLALDPELTDALAISKKSGLVNVTRSQLVPYTITLTNSIGAPVYDIDLIDNYPAGFKYIANSARLYVDDVRTTTITEEPLRNGLQLTWPSLVVNNNQTTKVKMLLVVGSGVSEGEYINRAFARNNRTLGNASGEANATVRVVPDPTFDCSDVIGKVFDDKNLNGYQDEGEKGLASARVVSAKGLKVTTDEHGRFHITCAIVPNEDRGSNFIIKLDERSLPTGYRLTTENPRVLKATRGKMLKFNFGAAIHRVVRLDMADAVFEEGSTRIRPQWISRLDILIEQLQKEASILRLSYLGDTEDESLVDKRMHYVKKKIAKRWEHINCCYKLKIETDVFWRRGAPADREAFKE